MLSVVVAIAVSATSVGFVGTFRFGSAYCGIVLLFGCGHAATIGNGSDPVIDHIFLILREPVVPFLRLQCGL
jgi:hypothetical protein